MLIYQVIVSILLKISIYSFSVLSIEGKTINFNDFQGKKILVVNTASNSKYSAQYASLEQLYQQHKNKMVIIATPSNDFNNELQSESDIRSSVETKYHISFLLTSKQNVKGPNISPVYKWLTESEENGQISNPVLGDYYKYLIDEQGNIIGVFGGSIDPMDEIIQNALNN